MIATLALLAAGAQPTSANPIIDFTDGRAEPVIGTVTYGYDFSVLSPVQVTGLGVFESFARLLGASHEVGLWDSTGTLLASATVDGTDTIVASTDALGQ